MILKILKKATDMITLIIRYIWIDFIVVDVSNRQGPKRRQGRCRHGKDSCVLCPAYCQLCDYRSTEIAVRKHIQRVHPVNTFDCEICGMKFGIRYDMRRHRMVHFDDQGNLTEQTKNKLRNGGKSDMLDIKLFQLELNFTALPEENSTNEDPMKGKYTLLCMTLG